MPDPAWYPTETLLAAKLRSLADLTQLGDPSGTGTLDADRLSEWLAIGRARVRTAVLVKHTPAVLDALDSETAIVLRRMAVIYAAQAAWSDGSGGLAMPPGLVEDVSWCDSECEKIAAGQRVLGGATGQTAPALRQPVGVINHDTLGTGTSVYAYRVNGFR